MTGNAEIERQGLPMAEKVVGRLCKLSVEIAVAVGLEAIDERAGGRSQSRLIGPVEGVDIGEH